jgi:hypothetical protein
LITKTANTYKVKNFDELIIALLKLKENSGRLMLPEGKSQLIDSGTASLMLQLNDKLTDPNIRPKFEADIMTWAGFLRLANFAWGNSTFNKSGSLKDIKSILMKLNAGDDYSTLFGEGVATEEDGVKDTRMDVYKPDPETIWMEIENDSNMYKNKLQPLWKYLSSQKLNEQYSRQEAYKLAYPIAKKGAERWHVQMLEWADDGRSSVKKPSEDDILNVTKLIVESFEREFEEQYYDYMKGNDPLNDMKLTSIKKVLQSLLKKSNDELGGIYDIDFSEWEGDGVDEETDAINMQKMISSGQAWTMQGSYGRSAMQYLEAGMCMLGKEGHNDYYGNYVPSRTEVKAGTKGSEALCKKNYPALYKKYIKLGL